jgi:hypothetical protein
LVGFSRRTDAENAAFYLHGHSFSAESGKKTAESGEKTAENGEKRAEKRAKIEKIVRFPANYEGIIWIPENTENRRSVGPLFFFFLYIYIFI